MPNTKSAKKAVRSSAKKHVFNERTKDKMKSSIKQFRKLTASGDNAGAKDALPKTMSAIDKAAKKNVIKKNKASRLKSRLSKSLTRS